MSDDQKRDIEELKGRSKRSRQKFQPVEDPTAEELASFPSEFSALRHGVNDTWGYRVPQLVPGFRADHRSQPRKKKAKRGAKAKVKEAYRVVCPGEPDIDAGVKGWVRPEFTADFVKLGDRMDALLETFDRVTVSRKQFDPDDPEDYRETPYVRSFHSEASWLKDMGGGIVERMPGKAKSITMRDTIGVSPAISRALQRMVEADLIDEAREAVESIIEPLGWEYEATFRGENAGAKVTSAVPHVTSGHFHIDLWVQSSYLSEAETGVNGEKIPVRLWDAKALCHHGPGPGVAFWMRHQQALGDLGELAKTEPEAAAGFAATKLLIEKTMAQSRKRAEKRGYPEDYARNIKINGVIDRLLSEALPTEFVEMGFREYREHLIEAYKDGKSGVRMTSPEDLEQVRKLAARSEEEARKLKDEAEKALSEAKELKNEADRIRREAEALRTRIDADTAEARKIGKDVEVDREAVLSTAGREAEVIVSEAREVERSAEIRGAQAAFRAVFPGQEPSADSPDGIVGEISDGLKAVRDALDDRETAVHADEQQILAREGELDWRRDQIDQAKSDLDVREKNVGQREKSAVAAETAMTRRTTDLNDRETVLATKERAHSTRVKEFRKQVRTQIGNFRELRSLRKLARMVQDLIPDLPTTPPSNVLGIKLHAVREWMAQKFGQLRERPRTLKKSDGGRDIG